MNTEKQPIRILIADDHAMILEGMISIISSDPVCKVVGKALNGVDAVALYKQLAPDITILDLQMPKMDGIQATREILKGNPQAKIVVLSAFDGEESIYQAIQAGATSYVLKESLLDELIQTIKAIAGGKRIIGGDVAAKYVLRTSKPVLSEREIEVLSLIAQGKTNGEIAYSLTLTEGTVKAHAHTILEKLGVSDRTAAVIEGLKRGLIRL